MGLLSASEICMCMCDPGRWRVEREREREREGRALRWQSGALESYNEPRNLCAYDECTQDI